MDRNYKQNGQIVILLLLVLAVVLAVALSALNRGITEVSTARKTEDSSRAFSAAEAGIDNILAGNPFSGQLGNSSSFQANTTGLGDALFYVYPANITKDDFAEIWLANPTDTSNPPAASYASDKFYIYFGVPESGGGCTGTTNYNDDPTSSNYQPRPAIEIQTIYYDGTSYQDNRQFFDPSSCRPSPSGYSACDSIDVNSGGSGNKYLCKATVSIPVPYPIMVVARILYSDVGQPLEIVSSDVVNKIPNQGQQYISIGNAGETQRKVQVSRLNKVMPFVFSFSLYSTGTLSK